MAPNNDVGSLEMSQGSCKMLPLSEKVESSRLKEKKLMLRLLICTVRMDLLFMKL